MVTTQPTCIHNVVSPGIDAEFTIDPTVISVREAQCGRRPFNRKSHGFLCVDHYRDQQDAIPPRPRKPYRQYVKQPLLLLNEEKFLQHILQLEKQTIAALRAHNQTKVVKCGKYDPLCIELVNAK